MKNKNNTNKKTKVESTISKKNKYVKNSDIDFNVINDINEEGIPYQKVIFFINQVIEPYMRTRTSVGRMYDPLATYKKYIRKRIEEIIEEKNYSINVGEDYYIEVECYITTTIPVSYNNKTKLLAANNKYKFNKKPDIDNVLKTTYDIMEKIVFFNDSQIVSETSKKYYDSNDSTLVIFSIYNQPNTSGRLSKNEQEEFNKLKEKEVIK